MKTENLLEVQGVHSRYGGIRALKGVDIEVGYQKIVALLGPNGAGKSTLIKTLIGLQPIEQGQIYFRGQKANTLSTEKIVRLGMSISLEGRRVFPFLTVQHNLKMGAYLIKKRKDWQDDLQRVYGYFHVLYDRRNQLAGTLSGGEQQMLAIGRALMARPQLLLLDEPSLGLAPLIVKFIAEMLVKLRAEGVSILLAEQNARMALAIADYAYVLETGTIRAKGNKVEITSNDYIENVYLGKKMAKGD